MDTRQEKCVGERSAAAPSLAKRFRVLLTAYLFAWMPFLALLLLSHLLLQNLPLRRLLPPGSGPRAVFRLSALAVLSAGIAAATLWLRRMIRSANCSEERYRLVVEQAAEGFLMVEGGGEFQVNQTACHMVGCDGVCRNGRRGCRHFREVAREVLASGCGRGETPLRRRDGSDLIVEASSSRLRDGRTIAVLRDVTARKQAEERLQESERRHRLLFERSLVGLFRIERDGVCTDCNDSFARTLGYSSREELLGRPAGPVLVDCCTPRPDLDQLRREGDLLSLEVQLKKRDGSVGWVLVNLVVIGEEQGTPGALAGTLVDLTAPKQAERELRALLAEKEELLREVHHRVKNNLQIIDSLLSLECATKLDEEVRAGFQKARDRVNSIALVHRMIYRSRELAQVDLRDYLGQLCDYLMACYWESARKIRLTEEVETAYVDLDTAILCGLIINELVSNALKHGFPDGRTGEIRLLLSPAGESRIRLVVEDNGVGLPDGFRIEEADRLGLQLVHALAAQLGGTVEALNRGGASFTIEFSRRKAARKEAA